MDSESDDEHVITVNIYDTRASNANFKVKQTTTAAEICKIILSKRDILSSESRFFSLVVVVTAFNPSKKIETHCLRTLKPNETLLDVQKLIMTKMMKKCSISDESKLENADKWYFKDMRTNPIELGATSDICGEYSSDEDEEITPSDLSYLAKSERKGYLLKRSNTDFNLWRRWYCVLMDQLWCVDIARESPRAKCVKLSGMIRYREGYKTLDQLQIIIINSADGKSHFFRAFNLIDQKKWIQDLNIKTRVAAENDSFSMAEMIITDEVDARSFRMVKQVGDLLDCTKTMEAIAFRRAVELRSNRDGGEEIQNCSVPSTPVSTASKMFTPMSRTNSMRQDPTRNPNSNFMMDETQPGSPEKEGDAEPVVAAGGRSLIECSPLVHPRCCSHLHLDTVHACDRVEGHQLVHELHRDSRIVTDILLFVIAVQRYREGLRRELYIPVLTQQESAKELYLKFILPQILFVDLDRYPDFNHEMLQLGGGNSNGAGSKLTSPSSPSRLTSLSGKGGAFSPVTSSSSSSSKVNDTRNEVVARVRKRGSSGVNANNRTASTEPIGTSAFAMTNWDVDLTLLMRVHKTLFEMHTKAIELQNGFVTQDPMQLVKYAAGSSKFRSKDRSAGTGPTLSVAQPPPAPVQTQSSSFWPWFGSSFSGANSNTNSTSSSPVPSRRGSDAATLAAQQSASPLPPPVPVEASTIATTPRDNSTTAFSAAAAVAVIDHTPSGLKSPSLGIADISSRSAAAAVEGTTLSFDSPSPAKHTEDSISNSEVQASSTATVVNKHTNDTTDTSSNSNNEVNKQSSKHSASVTNSSNNGGGADTKAPDDPLENKPPPVELFDEIVAALILKLS